MSSLLLLATLLPVILNFGCILIYIFYRKCRARQQEEGSADWDDVIWFRVNARDGRSLFSGVREPGTVTPRRRSLNSMKYPPDSSDFEKRTYGEVKGLTDNSCCICLEEYDDSSALTKLPCNHWMHSECIEKWFNRDVTCPLCKEVAIEKAYSDLLPIERVDLSGGSNSSSRNGSFSSRSTSRRPSLSRLIRDTLDQQAEVYFMYNNDQASNSGIMGFMRNLLQRERRQRSSRRGSRSSRRGSRSSQSGQESSVDEDVPPPDVEAAGGQGEEEEDSVDADQVDAVVRTDVENPAPRGE